MATSTLASTQEEDPMPMQIAAPVHGITARAPALQSIRAAVPASPAPSTLADHGPVLESPQAESPVLNRPVWLP